MILGRDRKMDQCKERECTKTDQSVNVGPWLTSEVTVQITGSNLCFI